MQIGGNFGFSIKEGLTNDQGAGVRRHGQPVLLVRLAAQDQLETAVVIHFDFLGFDMAGGGHPASLSVVSGLCSEAEVGDAVASTGNPIVERPRNGRSLIVVVRIVGAELGGFVGDAVQHRRFGVRVFDEGHQARARQTAQIPIAFRLTERIPGRARKVERGGGRLQRVAELVPRLTACHPLSGDFFFSLSAQLPRESRNSPEQGQ